MAKIREYDIKAIQTEYEKTLQDQENKETAIIQEPSFPESSFLHPFDMGDEEYVNPDKEDFKRLSLFMDWDVWERIQALCWSEKKPVNKMVVDKLREWCVTLDDDKLEQYRAAMKEKHITKWSEQRSVLAYWFQTSDIRNRMTVKSCKMNRCSLSLTEENGIVHDYYIHRNYITDGKIKFANVKTLKAQMKMAKANK